ncbi:ICE2-domain-containing protein [Meredithblackwellia eburnea MCA 4105]
MALFSFILGFTANISSFAQVLLYLPLALDIAGKEAMLALSLLLSVTFAFQATVHLVTRNTRLRPLSRTLTILQPLLIPIILLITLNIYSGSHPPLPTTSQLSFVWSILRQLPGWWETALRTSSPLFVILEGMSTLLCIQALSRFSMRKIQQSASPDLLQLVFLIASALVYVLSAYFLWESYDAVPDRISATLIGVTITSIVFLSGISFAVQKGNVVETSLMLAYAVFQIFHLSNRPEMYTAGIWQQVIRSTGKNGHPPLPPLVLQSLDAISGLVRHTVGAGVEFVSAVSSALPLPVLVGLFYRIAVLYAASRIILALKKQNEGYEETKRLSEEEPAARVMTVIITYARLILIAVYTHLLLLSSSGHQSFWRWLNVFLTITLWGIELRIGGTDDGHWKSE